MRNCFLGLILAVVAMLAVAPVLLAQSAVQAGAAKVTPDFSGIWMRAETARRFNQETPPMQPWAAEQVRAVREGVRDPSEEFLPTALSLRGPRNWAKGRDDMDPLIFCAPPGPTRILMLPRPFQIVQSPSRVLMLFEWDHLVRQIWTDGRGHAEGFPRTWMGGAIGRWDGDTLIVDTIGLNEYTWVDSFGHPQTEAMHIVERYRRVAYETLEVDLTFDDPEAYTRPWTGHYVFKLRPNREIQEHNACEDRLELPVVPRP